MNQDAIPEAPKGEPIEIGNKGYIPGNKFYLGLAYKRVKGKNRVRGPRKNHYSPIDLGTYTPWEWQGERGIEERSKKRLKIN